MPPSFKEKTARLAGQIKPSLDQAANWFKGVAGPPHVRFTDWYNSALATDFATYLDRKMRALFAAKATIYDKAMDATYNATHIGGGDHRLFDGSHDPIGAWEAVSHAVPGDTFTQKVDAYFTAMWKDMVTPKGLPLATFDHHQFQEVTRDLHDKFGIHLEWMKDMVTFTATEVIGAATGVLAVTLNWDGNDIKRFSSLVGSYGFSGLWGGNPFLLLLAVLAFGRAYQMARRDDEKRTLFVKGGLRGSIGSISFVTASSLLGVHVWIGLMFGICAGVMARHAFDRADSMLSSVDWSEVAGFCWSYLRKQATTAGPDDPVRYLLALPSPEMASTEVPVV